MNAENIIEFPKDESSEPFEAQFDSKCASCGEMMFEGDLIIRTGDGDYIHKECDG